MISVVFLKKRILTVAGLIALLLLLPATGVISACAETGNYRIYNPDWDDKTAEEAKLYGTWDMAEDKTGYTVSLYKGTTLVGTKRVGGGGRFDFSTFLTSKKGGSGTYHFTVYPTKGGPELKVESEAMEVTSAMITAIRNRIQKERKEAIAATGGGWVNGPGNIWIYYDKEGNQLKNSWIDYKDHKYYLDKNGFMLMGWQTVSNQYYYFEPKGTVDRPLGSLWTNTTTPDGYRVDENGVRLDKEGNPEKPVTYKLLSTVSVSLKEKQEQGKYTQVESIVCGSGKVSDMNFETDPATWTTDSTGRITFTVTLNESYRLKQGFKVVCTRSEGVIVLQHTATSFTAVLSYTPKYVLATPDNFYISDGTTLRWGKVSHADEYTVKITIAEPNEEGELKNSTKTVSTQEPYLELYTQDIDENTIVKTITVGAITKNTKKYINSPLGKIEDFATLMAERNVPGTFGSNNVGLYYYDESGQRVTGWKELLGHWYYFKKTGYAATGWLRDTATGHWYYFNENGQMLTGTVTLADGTYTLNDGSRTDLPLGAWIH